MADKAEQNGFGPVYRKRNPTTILKAQALVIIVSGLIFLAYRYLSSFRNVGRILSSDDLYFICGVSSALLLGELIRRLCLFTEEHHHSLTRYNGSYMKALAACISIPQGIWIVAVGLVISLIYTVQAWSFSILTYLIINTMFSLFANLLQLDGATQVEVSHLNEMKPMNVSAGAAWNYYFGYLKILLPAFPTIFEKARGDKFRIDNEDIREKVTDTCLFIVIPKDGYCYKALNLVDERITFQHTMPELKRTRGGVAERIYKNSLYKISIEGEEPKYAVIEYASPLLCFYDMAEHAKVDFSVEEKEKQVVQFYVNLQKIIDDDPECAGKCKLILTGPVAMNDMEGGTKMADIIYHQIE